MEIRRTALDFSDPAINNFVFYLSVKGNFLKSSGGIGNGMTIKKAPEEA